MKNNKNLSEQDKIIELMKKKSVIRPYDLKELSVSRQALSRLCNAGIVIKVARGLYRLKDSKITEYNTITESVKAVPNGVICLLSALSFYNLTTQSPYKVWIAIGVKAHLPRRTLPVRFVRFSGKALTEGIEIKTIEGIRVKIYSPAKTVADCFKYRNKIGLDVALEALREYSKSDKKNLDELWHYAKICRVSNIMRPYLEAILN